MKPLFSKSEKEVYLPGDPRRKAFEEQWRLAGGNPEEMEGQTITVDNGEIKKVTTFKCNKLASSVDAIVISEV